MMKYSTVVIGGGAAGLCAAISAAREGKSVLICEKTSQIGKKILASGNGRCNLLNENVDESYYNDSAKHLVKSVFSRFGKEEILSFFRGLGLEVYAKDGRIFPVTNQSASVLRLFEIELKRLGIPIEYNFNCNGIQISDKGITVTSNSRQQIQCNNVVVTGGGKTYPAYGSDGSLYSVAAELGHSMIEPVPSVVPLIVKDKLCFLLQGQKITALVRSIIQNKECERVEGDLIFTKYGLSGTAILDVSGKISEAISRESLKNIYLKIDLVPFLNERELERILIKRKDQKWHNENMLTGILPNKISEALQDIFRKDDLHIIINSLKNWIFKVEGNRGWNEAEFTSGGINVNEIKYDTLESKIKKGVFFAGEILDVNGKRGGYNLGWAWASGLLAGLTE
jgi:predicted Rossmann fold flavoprotein